MTKEKYAEILNLMPHEAMQILKEEADAERLVESIYGKEEKGYTWQLSLLFHACCEEIREVTFLEAYKRVAVALMQKFYDGLNFDPGVLEDIFSQLFQDAKEIFTQGHQLSEELQGNTS